MLNQDQDLRSAKGSMAILEQSNLLPKRLILCQAKLTPCGLTAYFPKQHKSKSKPSRTLGLLQKVVSDLLTTETNRIPPHPSSNINFFASEAPLLEGQSIPFVGLKALSTSSTPSINHPGTDPYFLNMPSFTLFSALHNNSRLLGISCLFPSPRQSPPGTTDLPLALHPIPLQLENYHLPYIDCLPLPVLRHNLILFNGLFDDETFCYDLTTSSNCIAKGSQSWDPSGWVISEGFKERWTFLFR